ncbi:hypothetical protein ACIPY5_14955 [Microbacterium sp. NPDC089698]|uniref:hypothetical protein n=1 Tax=Microbacterium sp. NPDC089698 TaxID=3364200 RepID=UPI003809F5D4
MTQPEAVAQLRIDDGGTWVVTTASGSMYMLDLDARTVIRLALDDPHDQAADSAGLRRDGEELTLVGFVGDLLVVGAPAVLIIHGASETLAATTFRATTAVAEIRRLES